MAQSNKRTTDMSKASSGVNNKVEGFDEALTTLWKMWRQLETYKLVFGQLEDPYGKVDMMTAYRTYREKDNFHQNFGRYVEALRVKLEATESKQSDELPCEREACRKLATERH